MVYRTNDIYSPGHLTSISDQIYAGVPANSIKRLTTDELARIPNIYARLPLNFDISELVDSEDYPMPDGNTIKGGDIKAITMLMYDKPRTAYWKPSQSQIRDSSVCGAVPLPLLGFKRFRAQEYNTWNQPPEGDHEYSNCDDLSRDYKFEWHDDDQDTIQRIFKIDLMLGRLLSSTYYDVEEGKIKFRKDGNGLLLTNACLLHMGAFSDEDTDLTYADVRYLREHGVGNYKGGFAAAYGAINLTGECPENVNYDFLQIYNAATIPMKLLLAQRWVWYGMHRNSDMISDPEDWNHMPNSVDTDANSYKDLPAMDTTGNAGIRGVFGL